jgi:hypothetical protein
LKKYALNFVFHSFLAAAALVFGLINVSYGKTSLAIGLFSLSILVVQSYRLSLIEGSLSGTAFLDGYKRGIEQFLALDLARQKEMQAAHDQEVLKVLHSTPTWGDDK